MMALPAACSKTCRLMGIFSVRSHKICMLVTVVPAKLKLEHAKQTTLDSPSPDPVIANCRQHFHDVSTAKQFVFENIKKITKKGRAKALNGFWVLPSGTIFSSAFVSASRLTTGSPINLSHPIFPGPAQSTFVSSFRLASHFRVCRGLHDAYSPHIDTVCIKSKTTPTGIS
jgi:hypothetical protein